MKQYWALLLFLIFIPQMALAHGGLLSLGVGTVFTFLIPLLATYFIAKAKDKKFYISHFAIAWVLTIFVISPAFGYLISNLN